MTTHPVARLEDALQIVGWYRARWKLEGKTAKLKNPHAEGALARLSWVVGRLGGWDGYDGHGYKPAGPITMARGMTRFDAIREGWEILKDV